MNNIPKIHVAVLCGGQSAEHEISVRSACNIINALDQNKYEVTLIAIDKQGQWHLGDTKKLENSVDLRKISDANTLALNPGKQTSLFSGFAQKIDVVFPVLHGPYGEDGTVQGLLKLANVPFVGCDVLGSAINMDKDVMKRLLHAAGIPVVPFLVFKRTQLPIDFDAVVQTLGLPFFVKPANLGSSVGISKVHQLSDFDTAIQTAFQYDHKIIIESHIQGREIECAVLGNDHPIVSLPGELIPHHEFYSYEAKYLDDNGASFDIPAKLESEVTKSIQALALRSFEALACYGMARVDFFLTADNQIFVNEINTIPGFTNISMYPQLWQASGIGYSELIEKLIDLAIEKFEADKQLKTSVHNL